MRQKKHIAAFPSRQLSPPFPFCKGLSHILHIQIPTVDPKIPSRAGLCKPGFTAGPHTSSGQDSKICFNLSPPPFNETSKTRHLWVCLTAAWLASARSRSVSVYAAGWG